MNSARRAAVFVSSVLLAGGIVVAQQPPDPTTKPQTQPPTTRPQTTQPAQSGLQALDGQTVTVTGCLVRESEAGQRSTAGQKPETTTARAGSGDEFMLTNVQVKSASPAGGGKPGEAARDMPTAAGTRGMNVKLTKAENEKLETNLNRQVEVTGRLDVSASAGRSTAGGTTPPSGGAAASGSQPAAELQVQSVRVVAQTCPGAK